MQNFEQQGATVNFADLLMVQGKYQEKPLRIFKVIQKKLTAQTMNYLREANIVVVSLIPASEP